MASRGCPFYCTFCSSWTIHGRQMRYNSINRLRDDFERIKDLYGAKRLVFYDDMFLADKERGHQILAILKDLEMTCFFPSSLALYTLDRKMLEALKSVGVNHIVLSIESGSSKVLKLMRKPLKLDITERVINDCNELDIATDISILMGIPGETKQDIEDAQTFFKSIKPTWFRFSVATPLVGTELLDIARENDYVKGDYINCDYKKGIIETEDFSPAYIEEKIYFCNLKFNFVLNNDYVSGNYSRALKGFENAIRVRPDHAFAYYFAAKSYKKIGLEEEYLTYKTKYLDIISESKFWKDYANKFSLSGF